MSQAKLIGVQLGMAVFGPTGALIGGMAGAVIDTALPWGDDVVKNVVTNLLAAPTPNQPVAPIGRRKVAMIYVHALQPNFVDAKVTMISFAAKIVAACRDLAERNQNECVATSDPDIICPADCEQVRKAYETVGLPPKDGLTGVWSGPVRQPGVDSYSVKITLRNCDLNQSCGEIVYPEVNCGGTLTLLSTSPSTYVFRERLTYGKDRCADDGQ